MPIAYDSTAEEICSEKCSSHITINVLLRKYFIQSALPKTFSSDWLKYLYLLLEDLNKMENNILKGLKTNWSFSDRDES